MKPAKSVRLCSGCDNNFYNGNNPMGVARCWSFDDAKVVKRLAIGKWQNPPYSLQMKDREWTLSCWGSNDVLYIDPPKVLDSRGFWKFRNMKGESK